jgi:hypothetical protein
MTADEFLEGKALKRGDEYLKIDKRREGVVPVFAVTKKEIDELLKKQPMQADAIKHFAKDHFIGSTIGGNVFLYCPVGNICSWSQGDVEHKYCAWCKKDFKELANE